MFILMYVSQHTERPRMQLEKDFFPSSMSEHIVTMNNEIIWENQVILKPVPPMEDC